ncbi:hypothetical protein [Methanopyrus kandleri]|uniref:Uncharacterized membrane protein n=2 Tax=Methanopyrus kandleri TaxID=2320 RepID=Q8TWB1_METKA|nr:hypothetical protein [Methanopyrus kandleri]AAM02337.1 Uncharacterized membrane protein [Methanopyrus kandleri AV19]HII69758.1 hypothetical protein [Methanopyrus kandleri]
MRMIAIYDLGWFSRALLADATVAVIGLTIVATLIAYLGLGGPLRPSLAVGAAAGALGLVIYWYGTLLASSCRIRGVGRTDWGVVVGVKCRTSSVAVVGILGEGEIGVERGRIVKRETQYGLCLYKLVLPRGEGLLWVYGQPEGLVVATVGNGVAVFSDDLPRVLYLGVIATGSLLEWFLDVVMPFSTLADLAMEPAWRIVRESSSISCAPSWDRLAREVAVDPGMTARALEGRVALVHRDVALFFLSVLIVVLGVPVALSVLSGYGPVLYELIEPLVAVLQGVCGGTFPVLICTLLAALLVGYAVLLLTSPLLLTYVGFVTRLTADRHA